MNAFEENAQFPFEWKSLQQTVTNKSMDVVVVTGSGGEEGERDVRMLLLLLVGVVERKRYVQMLLSSLHDGVR